MITEFTKTVRFRELQRDFTEGFGEDRICSSRRQQGKQRLGIKGFFFPLVPRGSSSLFFSGVLPLLLRADLGVLGVLGVLGS